METIVIESTGDNLPVYTLAVLAFALALESFIPRRELAGGMLSRWTNNFSLSLLSWYISMVLSTAFILWLASWVKWEQIGLFNQLAAPAPVIFVALLLVSQFLGYWVHYAYHHISWLWPLHAVHHSDIDVDVSTSYRHHPLEPLLSMPIVTPLILLLGVSPEVAVAFKFYEVAATVFSHSNVRIPEPLEKVLRYIILTPDFHRLHHASDPQYTNSNYGSLVPWYDYLFGTASNRPYAEQESMELGLEYEREAADNRLDKLLVQPVRVYRDTGGHVPGD